MPPKSFDEQLAEKTQEYRERKRTHKKMKTAEDMNIATTTNMLAQRLRSAM